MLRCCLDVKSRQMKLLRKEIARIRCQLKLQTPTADDAEAASTGKLRSAV